ncbi:hypothetical protein F506_15175 [Herbaspirillum hiltneri N3]|uniref:Uncharacterized protein n=1 Tax=Herbaspirillum hiltneri N3 TaxID=1262470 RepID=A0ABM5V361_9BURK|nr:hypothetical protein F506_15175 [Herbaspirillum hiltneri N3]
MLDALGDHEHLAGLEMHCAVAKVDAQRAVEHDEDFVGVGVVVPDELALYLGQLELVVVHFGNDALRPVLAEQRKLVGEIDGAVFARVDGGWHAGSLGEQEGKPTPAGRRGLERSCN